MPVTGLDIVNRVTGGGGGGTPGGADSDVQFNDGGSFGGDSGFTYDGAGTVTADEFVGVLTGNAGTATALQTARTIGGTSFNGTANIVPATITVADTTDSTSFVALFESATGDLAPKTDAGITYNASTGALTATGFAGPLTGNVTGNVSGSSGSTTGNAATATALQNARTINGVSFDGTANVTVTAAADTLSGSTLASGVSASSLTSLGTLTALSVSGDITAGATSTFLWTGRSKLTSPADGVLLLTDNAGTAVGGIKLGGTTSSFVYLKRNSTVLESRLGDDSGYADLRGAVVTGARFVPNGSTVASNGMYLSAANTLDFSTNSTKALEISSTQAAVFSSTVAASNLSGTNTGDQTSVSGNAGTATALATPRAIYGNNFDGSAALTQIIASTFGGTGNGFTKFTGPATSEKTFTLPDANSTIVVQGGALGTPSSGVATNLTGTASGLTAGVATTGTTVAVSNSASYFPLLAASSSNSNQAFNLDTTFTYNPSTDTLTAGAFVGNLTGNVTGTVSGLKTIGPVAFDYASTTAVQIGTTSNNGKNFIPLYVTFDIEAASSPTGAASATLGVGVTSPSYNETLFTFLDATFNAAGVFYNKYLPASATAQAYFAANTAIFAKMSTAIATGSMTGKISITGMEF